MSKLPTQEHPQLFVNGELEEPEEKEEQADSAAAAGEQVSLVSPEEEEDKRIQVKIQSVFQQVRNQIRSQVESRNPSSSILELMQKMKEREERLEQEEDESSEKEMGPGGSTVKMDATQEELCEAFGKKLEAAQKTFRNEMESRISQVRAESQAYTEQAIKDLESRMRSKLAHLQPEQPSQQEKKVPDKKQQPSASSSLASRRGRVLTRTMTTIIPKTCAPLMIGPQAKPEPVGLRRRETSGPARRDPVLPLPGRRLQQGRRPVLPPAVPAQHCSVNKRLGRSSTGS